MPEREPSAFTRIATGFNSDVFRHGNHVAKISKRARTSADAHRAMRTSFDEFDITARYLGDTVVDTVYYVAEHTVKRGRFVVVAGQPFIDGTPLEDAEEIVDETALKAVYESALDMYDDTGSIPDLACIEHGFFDARKTPNIIVTPDGTPKLIDPNTGKLQGSRLFGPLWNFWISEGVKRALYDM